MTGTRDLRPDAPARARRGRAGVWATLAALTLGSLGVGLAGTAHADDSGPTVNMGPASRQATGQFEFDTTPGATVHETVVLSNSGSSAVTARLAPLDAVTAVGGGGPAYPPIDTKPTGPGSWITPDQTSVPIDPHRQVKVRFSVSVPKDATPGVHLGGLAAWLPPTTNPRGDQTKVQVQYVSRTIIPVQVRLPGGDGPHLKVDSVTPQARALGAYLILSLVNAGGDYATGNGTLTVDGKPLKDFSFGRVIPDTTLTVPFKWEDSPAVGTHPATLHVSYNDKTLDWSGTFQVTPKVQDDLNNLGAPTNTPAATPSQGGGILLKVLIGVGCLIVVAIIVGLVLWLRRRRRRPPVPVVPVRPGAPGQAGRVVSPPAGTQPRGSTPPAPPADPNGQAASAPPQQRVPTQDEPQKAPGSHRHRRN